MKKITVGAPVLSTIADDHILDSCTPDQIQFCVSMTSFVQTYQFLVRFTGITGDGNCLL